MSGAKWSMSPKLNKVAKQKGSDHDKFLNNDSMCHPILKTSINSKCIYLVMRFDNSRL